MTSATCNFEWPMNAADVRSFLHRCCEPVGHDDSHTCRCTARQGVDW